MLQNVGSVDRIIRVVAGVALIGADHFMPTVGSAVNLYRSQHTVDWKDWDEA